MNSYISAHDVLAVVLVGGEGSRLGPLTLYRTKPAVMAGPAVLASFSTSAALNSGIDKVILASQYLPFSLESFYAKVYGSEFGHYKKIDVIGPHHTREDGRRYLGTADAFNDALKIGVKHQREYVLGLSGDHIYSFNFEKLLRIFPKKYGDNSFVVLTTGVPRDQASRFGILETEEGGTRVRTFFEKPSRSILSAGKDFFDASMGIYFAPLRLWQRILAEDQKRGKNRESNYDIGGDIIPHMINEKRYEVHVFPFDGFWADVGEPAALYETCRKIFLERNPDIFGKKRYGIGAIGEPNFFSSDNLRFFSSGACSFHNSHVNGSIFSPGVEISSSEVLDSILLGQAQGHDLTVRDSVLKNCFVDKMCNINKSEIMSERGLVIITRRTVIGKGVKVYAKGNALIAPYNELVDKIYRLEKYIHSTEAEIYDNFGTRYTFAELVAEKKRKETGSF